MKSFFVAVAAATAAAAAAAAATALVLKKKYEQECYLCKEEDWDDIHGDGDCCACEFCSDDVMVEEELIPDSDHSAEASEAGAAETDDAADAEEAPAEA